ncbi:MAG: hypothetical protein ACK5LM_05210 [Lactovum sp.]
MTGERVSEHDIMISKVYFEDGKNYKKRPSVVIKADVEELCTFNVTSEFLKLSGKDSFF